MAFTYKSGKGGKVSDSISGNALAINPGILIAELAVGDLVVVVYAGDNLGSSPDGDKGDVTSVTDAASHTWIKAVEFSNVQTGAGTGATVSIWYTVVTNTNLASANILVSLAGNVTQKVAQIAYWQTGGAAVNLITPQTLANDGADAGAITMSGLTSREYLFIRAVAIENNTATGTKSTNYSDFVGTGAAFGTTGGGAASNMWLHCEQRIVTATGDTTDPTTGAADCASAMVAFWLTAAAADPIGKNKLYQREAMTRSNFH